MGWDTRKRENSSEENIEYDILTQDPQQDKEQLDEVVDLMAEPSAPADRPSWWPGTSIRQRW